MLEEAYDPRYGARPIKHYVENTIVTELARMVVEGSLPEKSTVRIKKARGREELEYAVEAQARGREGPVKKPRVRSENGGVNAARAEIVGGQSPRYW